MQEKRSYFQVQCATEHTGYSSNAFKNHLAWLKVQSKYYKADITMDCHDDRLPLGYQKKKKKRQPTKREPATLLRPEMRIITLGICVVCTATYLLPTCSSPCQGKKESVDRVAAMSCTILYHRYNLRVTETRRDSTVPFWGLLVCRHHAILGVIPVFKDISDTTNKNW